MERQFSRKEFLDFIRFCQENQLKQTEECFRHECHTHADVDHYFQIYSCLSKFILESAYRIELIQFLFPIFVHIYIKMIDKQQYDECEQFYDQFIRGTIVENLHEEFFYQLKMVSRSSIHLHQYPLTDALGSARFFLRLSMTSCNEMENFLQSLKRSDPSMPISLILSIIQENLKIDINRQVFMSSHVVRYQTQEQPMTPLFVHKTFAKTIQFTRLYTGVFPLRNPNSDVSRCSASSSQMNRPDWTSQYRLTQKIDFNSVPRLGPHQLPSICSFTLKPEKDAMINCVVVSNDCRLFALGFQSSEILVCSVDPQFKLKSMKPVKQIEHLLNNPLMRNVSTAILESSTSNERLLVGHTGAIYSLSFEPSEQIHLISGSEDRTIRLWHLQLWTCLCVYKMHGQPVLNVNFSPTGYLFASCGIDSFLCLWSIEKINPIRIYPEYGHSGSIYLVEFHPNSYYLASAHHDHTIHLWNVHQDTPSLVRIFNGHRHQLSALRFSPNGHFLGSGCWHGEFILWDIQNNLQIAHLFLHKEAITSIEFSPLSGTLLLLGSLDKSISLWNCFMITKIYDEKLGDSSSMNKILLNIFKTKTTSIHHMRFSKENILYAFGILNE